MVEEFVSAIRATPELVRSMQGELAIAAVRIGIRAQDNLFTNFLLLLGSCAGSECWDDFLTTLAIIAGFIGAVSIVVCLYCSCYCCYHCYWKGPPKQTGRKNNPEFVDCELSHRCTLVKNVFQTGIWSSRYYQHGRWHGPHQMHLAFNGRTMGFTGSGCDDVGEYTIDGIFSDKTQRMGLTKYYKKGTGDVVENVGHSVTIQVTFNEKRNRFVGKWYVQTIYYAGQGEFSLKLDESFV